MQCHKGTLCTCLLYKIVYTHIMYIKYTNLCVKKIVWLFHFGKC